jgi:hypothetical protein
MLGTFLSFGKGTVWVVVLFSWWFLGLGLFLGFSGCCRLGVLAGFGVSGWVWGGLCGGF